MLALSDKAVGKFKRDAYSEGSWYGNDTIWRTFWDINRCLMYSDRQGVLCDAKQRKFLTIADMVISGEKDGPVHASPKEVGIVVAGLNSVVVDILVAQLMGFDYEKIPALSGIINGMQYPLWEGNRSDIRAISEVFGEKNIDEVPLKWNFIPTKGWKNHIEKEEVQ